MIQNLYKKTKNHKLIIFILILLFVIPFFWIKPNEMDLGGDSSRLYFYDPLSYATTSVLYSALPTGVGLIDSGFYSALPHMAFLITLKFFLNSPYLLITIFNIAKLVIGFLAVYAITKELINQSDGISAKPSEYASILAGLFYILSRHMISNYDMALLYHNQVFLNPLMFYLLLKYFLTKDARYGWLALIISFIFASSFGFLASPPFFAFYPLAIVFLLLYVTFIRHIRLPWKGILVGLLIFLGLHAFHILPILFDIFRQGSHVQTRLFDKEGLLEQVGIFFGILQLASIHKTLFLPSLYDGLRILSILFPLTVIVGFFLNKKRDKTILLTGFFFLVTFFLLTAKIAQTGIDFYSRLFYIPGLSLFRNFTGIWTYVYSFFYSLLFGLSLFYIFKRISLTYTKYLFILIGMILIVSGWPLISGTRANPVHYQSKNVKTAIVMDPLFEETLRFIKSLPNDSKFLTLPFTDCCFQVLFGINNGAYIGPSLIGYLAGKSDFTGYANSAPYSELFFRLAKEKNYEAFKQMLGLLNVQYIFHNEDSKILDKFPINPFSPDYVRKYFPNDQDGYKEFVKNISSKKIYERGTYKIYEIDEKYFLPHFYSPKKIFLYDNDIGLNQTYARTLSFFPQDDQTQGFDDPRIIFVDRVWCKEASLNTVCSGHPDRLDHSPRILFEKINRTKYRLKISDVSAPYILVFSEVFNSNWNLVDATNIGQDPVSNKVVDYFKGDISEVKHTNTFFDSETFETWGKSEVSQDRHFEVNGYANAWYIRPDDMKDKKDYELILELTSQRPIYILLPISVTFFVTCLFWGILLYNRKP